MNKNDSKKLGIFLIISSIAFIIFYTWTVFFSEFELLVIKVSMVVFAGIIVIFIIWMGKVMIQSSSNK